MLDSGPAGWSIKRVSEICEINPKGLSAKTDPAYAFNYVAIDDLDEGRISNSTRLTFAEAPSRARRLVRAGDVVVSTVRPYLRAFSKVHDSEDGFVVSTGFCVLRPKVGVTTQDFMTQQVFSEPFVEHLKTRMTGSNYPAVKAEDIEEFELFLPPLREQERIAEILSSVDESIRAAEAVIAQAERVKRGLMEDLLTGGLGSEAIARGDVPEGCRKIDFSSVFVVKNDKSKKIQKSKYSARGTYPIVDQSSDFIAGYTEGVPNMNFPVIIFGDHTRCVKWIDFPFFTGADGTQALYPSDEIISKFGFYLIQSAKLPNLGYSRHMRELKRLRFVIPRKAIQQEIVTVLDAVENQINANRKTADKLRYLKQGLMNDLLSGRVRTVS